jgi:hypothetical protein
MVYGKCEGDLITQNMDRQKEILVKRDSTYMGRREKHRFNNTKKKQQKIVNYGPGADTGLKTGHLRNKRGRHI